MRGAIVTLPCNAAWRTGAKMAKKKTTKQGASEKVKLSRKDIVVLDEATRARYERILVEVSKSTQPVEDAIRESQQLSKDDFAIMINARG